MFGVRHPLTVIPLVGRIELACCRGEFLISWIGTERRGSNPGPAPCSRPLLGRALDSGPTKFFCLDSADDSLNLTDLTYLALQHGATQLKTLAYEINVGLELKKQVRMPYWHAQIVCRLLNSFQIGLKYVEL
jgi:hypothetical protein